MLLFKKLFKICAAFIFLPAALFLSLYSLEQQGFFSIESIDIQVKTKTSQKNFVSPRVERLQKKLDVYRGISLWKAPLSQISKTLRSEAWIKNFQLSRSWPSGLELVIVPDEVALLVISEGSRASAAASGLYPVTMSGKVLEKISAQEAPNAIVSHDPALLKSQSVREGAVQLVKALPAAGLVSSMRISELGYDNKDGYWLKLLQSETKVNMGEEQFEIKSARVSQVMEYLDGRNLKARVIDANLSKKVLVRLQQNP